MSIDIKTISVALGIAAVLAGGVGQYYILRNDSERHAELLKENNEAIQGLTIKYALEQQEMKHLKETCCK